MTRDIITPKAAIGAASDQSVALCVEGHALDRVLVAADRESEREQSGVEQTKERENKGERSKQGKKQREQRAGKQQWGECSPLENPHAMAGLQVPLPATMSVKASISASSSLIL